MSSNKLAKQQRRSNDSRVITNRLIVWNHYSTGEPVTAKRLGKMRKQHPLNCGNARCQMCGNPRRLFGHITFSEMKDNLRYSDMKRDAWEDYCIGFGESIGVGEGISGADDERPDI